MANVSSLVVFYAERMAARRGAPDEVEYLDAWSIDFVRDVAKGDLAGPEVQAVAMMLDARSVELFREAEEAAEEEYQRTKVSVFGDDGTAYAGKFL
jgi:hypothetical protein